MFTNKRAPHVAQRQGRCALNHDLRTPAAVCLAQPSSVPLHRSANPSALTVIRSTDDSQVRR